MVWRVTTCRASLVSTQRHHLAAPGPGFDAGAILVGDGHDKSPDVGQYIDPMAENLIAKVSTKEPYVLHPVGAALRPRAPTSRSWTSGARPTSCARCCAAAAPSRSYPGTYDFNSVRDGLTACSSPTVRVAVLDPAGARHGAARLAEWDRPIFGICMATR